MEFEITQHAKTRMLERNVLPIDSNKIRFLKQSERKHIERVDKYYNSKSSFKIPDSWVTFCQKHNEDIDVYICKPIGVAKYKVITVWKAHNTKIKIK